MGVTDDHKMTCSTSPGVQDAIVPMRRVSPDDGGHWLFGYYEKCPWNKSGRYLLGCRVEFVDRQPNPGEKMTVGMFDLMNNDQFIELDQTPSWSWQQGTMLQWRGGDSEKTVIYNSQRDGQPCGVIRDVASGGVNYLPMCVYAVSPTGKRAVTLDFGRLHRLRPGYGYANFEELTPDQATPETNGIFGFNLPPAPGSAPGSSPAPGSSTAPVPGSSPIITSASADSNATSGGAGGAGGPKLLISLAQLAALQPRPEMNGVHHWVNHLQWNTTGSHFAFLHRWQLDQHGRHQTRMCVARADGSDLRVVWDSLFYSHYDWRDDRHILGYTCNQAGQRGFYLHDRQGQEVIVQAYDHSIITSDGHCSYSPPANPPNPPDRRWILNDTYPQGPQRMRSLMLFDPATQKRIDLAKIHAPAGFEGAIRCDLHPRWNRDGTQICIDSFHEKTRGMYLLDVSSITKPA